MILLYLLNLAVRPYEYKKATESFDFKKSNFVHSALYAVQYMKLASVQYLLLLRSFLV